MPIKEQIENLASFLDTQGKQNAEIHVRGSRAYLRQWFKPAKRGGPLLANGHELKLEKQPEGAPLDQASLL